MTNEQMDAHLEKITCCNCDAARIRAQRQKYQAYTQISKCQKEERERHQRRQKAVYRTAFHISAFITAGCLIWGLSLLYEGLALAGLTICIEAGIFGLTASICDCLGR